MVLRRASGSWILRRFRVQRDREDGIGCGAPDDAQALLTGSYALILPGLAFLRSFPGRTSGGKISAGSISDF